MSTPLICHFLIGTPGSGKSTFAALLAKLGNYRIVSTDAIRQQLYGDAIIQGEWSSVEELVISQIGDAITQSYSIIYDATNAKRQWRMDLLIKLNSSLTPLSDFRRGVGGEVQWMAWYLQTPKETCIAWNQKRDRIVPDIVIERMYKSLQDFPPLVAEGFAAVKEIDVTSPQFDIQQIDIQIKSLSRSIINRTDRTLHRHILKFV